MTYTPKTTALAAELYSYDTLNRVEDFVYNQDEIKEKYLEQALFIQSSEWFQAHNSELIAAHQN